MRIQKILLDNDGILTDLIFPFWEHYHNKKYGTNITRDNPPKKYFLRDQAGISLDEEVKRLDEFFEIYPNLPPVKGAKAFIDSLEERGYFFSVATDRLPNLRERTLRELRDNFNGKINRIFFTPDYKGKQVKKFEVCMDGLGYDVLIDDNPQNVAECHKNGVNAWLFNGPYNQNENVPKKFRVEDKFRVFSYYHILEKLEETNEK